MIESTFYPEPDDLHGPAFIPQDDQTPFAETDDRSDEMLNDLADVDDQASAPEGITLSQHVERCEQSRDETYQWVEGLGSAGVAL